VAEDSSRFQEVFRPFARFGDHRTLLPATGIVDDPGALAIEGRW
jgi:hypothetical protein